MAEGWRHASAGEKETIERPKRDENRVWKPEERSNDRAVIWQREESEREREREQAARLYRTVAEITCE